MDKKILTVTGMVMAAVFLIVFMTVWTSAQSAMQKEVNTINDMYRADVAFDINLFDEKIVTGRSIRNLADDLSTNNQYSAKLIIYKGTASSSTVMAKPDNKYSGLSVSDTAEYKTGIHRSKNGAVDGIIIYN